MTLSRAQYDPAVRMGARDGNNINYATATVIQATNRTTGVTINTLSGNITTNTTSLAAETAAVFTVTNANVFADDVVIVTMQGGSNGGNTTIATTTTAVGSFQITVANQNASGGTAETGAIVINFLIMRAAITS